MRAAGPVVGRRRGKSLAAAIDEARERVGVFAADLLAWFPPPPIAEPVEDEQPVDAAIRIAEYRENTRRATAAAFIVAEFVGLIRNALTKRKNTHTRTGAARARGEE